MSNRKADLSRRRMIQLLSLAGMGAAVAGRIGATEVTPEMIRQAEWLAGLEYDDDERQLMLEDMQETVKSYESLRSVPLDNSVAPALRFDPWPLAPSERADPPRRRAEPSEWATASRPSADEDVAFLPVSELSGLLRRRELSSVELTRLYLDRLQRLNPTLGCVIRFTESLAMQQAERADREIGNGRYRGPLHGIPWGAKDLLAEPGYPTTWGASPYRNQVRNDRATVNARLEQAGAVLVAKLSLGALAWGDVWFDAMTRNPWNTEQGSSGSSAGSASATAAGLVGFAIGSETWGSIVSPCTRCGVTGLRPSFGRVSRHGAMALSWSMDKIGPIARSVEDTALVLDAIHGADGLDPTAVDRPFHWPPRRDVRSLRVGFVAELFDEDRAEGLDDAQAAAVAREWQQFDLRTLDTLRDIGIDPRPISLPSDLPIDALALILTAEASAAFDELTRSGRDDELVRQVRDAWPNVFRQGQLIPAVEYIRANRIRSLLVREMDRLFESLDVYVSPSYGGSNLLLTNLTGHPCAVLPNGFRSGNGTPTSVTLVGRPFGETDLLSLAHAYQQATGFHLARPEI